MITVASSILQIVIIQDEGDHKGLVISDSANNNILHVYKQHVYDITFTEFVLYAHLVSTQRNLYAYGSPLNTLPYACVIPEHS